MSPFVSSIERKSLQVPYHLAERPEQAWKNTLAKLKVGPSDQNHFNGFMDSLIEQTSITGVTPSSNKRLTNQMMIPSKYMDSFLNRCSRFNRHVSVVYILNKTPQ